MERIDSESGSEREVVANQLTPVEPSPSFASPEPMAKSVSYVIQSNGRLFVSELLHFHLTSSLISLECATTRLNR